MASAAHRSRSPRARRARTVLGTFGVAAFLLPGTLIIAMLATLTSWVPPRGALYFFLARQWARCLLAAGGIRVEVEHEGGIDPGKSYVFLANHQSYFDIPVLLATVPGQVRFAAKRSLFKIPVFGWSLAAGGFIPVDPRRSSTQAKSVFAAAGRRLAAGVSVFFFPEGSRSEDGRLAPFERGGFLVAVKSGLPIVPVGLRGAYEVLPRHRLTVHPGTVTVRYGRPIEVAGLGVRQLRELTARVRQRILELSEVEDGAGGESSSGNGPSKGDRRGTISPLEDSAAGSSPGELRERMSETHDG